MRRISIVLALLTAGCAALFQDKLGDDPTTDVEPRCSTSKGLAALDGVFAASGVLEIIVGIGLQDLPDETRGSLIVGGILDLVIHGASAGAGASWANECQEARDQWSGGGAGKAASDDTERAALARSMSNNPQNHPKRAWAFWCSSQNHECVANEDWCLGACHQVSKVWCANGDDGFLCGSTRDSCATMRDERRDRSFGECVEWRPGLARPPEKKPTPIAPISASVPRAHYCTTSVIDPRAGVCVRQKTDCTRLRDAVAAAVPDLTPCTLTEVAQCFDAGPGDERCAPTLDGCSGAQARQAAIVAPAPVNDCMERR